MRKLVTFLAVTAKSGVDMDKIIAEAVKNVAEAGTTAGSPQPAPRATRADSEGLRSKAKSGE